MNPSPTIDLQEYIMIENFLKNKNWNTKIVGEFIKQLQNYTNEEKCCFVNETAKELLKRGGNANISSAENLLIYATQHYFDKTEAQVKADIYYILGSLYEIHKENFVRAYTYYEKYTLNNKENSGTHSLMLKALILRDDFTYSEKLEKEFRMSLAETDLGLKNDRVYENIGRYIILNHEGNEEECKKVMKRLWGIIKNDEILVLDMITKKDLKDRVKVPMKVKEYIKTQNEKTSFNRSVRSYIRTTNKL